jgi:hypothetical protein
MDAPAQASKTYDLHFLLNDKRWFWTNPNHGVTIVDAGRDSCLQWQEESGPGRALWTDIAAVTMITATDGKQEVNHCRIAFRDGCTLTVTDSGAAGTVDHDRTPVYRDFVRALHRRLAQAPAGTITFSAGMSQTRYRVMQVLMVIMALLFVALPLALVFIVRDWRVLFTLAAGAAFVWPFWKVMEKGQPRTYDPNNPPGELME